MRKEDINPGVRIFYFDKDLNYIYADIVGGFTDDFGTVWVIVQDDDENTKLIKKEDCYY